MLRVVRRNKAQIDKLLFQAKIAIIREGKKMALEYVMNQIPTEQQVIAKLEELSKENPKEAKKYYDKIKNSLEGIKNKLSKSLIKIETIETKLESAESKITYISSIANIVEPFIDTLMGIKLGADAIVTTAGAAPTTPPGPIASSATLREKVKGVIQKTGSSLLLAARMVIMFNKTFVKLKRQVTQARNKITQLISYIDNILTILQLQYVNTLLPLLEDSENLSYDALDNLDDYYPGLNNYLNGEDPNFSFLDLEKETNTTNGISNIAPRFYKQYRTGSVENPNTEE